jgi:hypothetical protein
VLDVTRAMVTRAGHVCSAFRLAVDVSAIPRENLDRLRSAGLLEMLLDPRLAAEDLRCLALLGWLATDGIEVRIDELAAAQQERPVINVQVEPTPVTVNVQPAAVPVTVNVPQRQSAVARKNRDGSIQVTYEVEEQS